MHILLSFILLNIDALLAQAFSCLMVYFLEALFGASHSDASASTCVIRKTTRKFSSHWSLLIGGANFCWEIPRPTATMVEGSMEKLCFLQKLMKASRPLFERLSERFFATWIRWLIWVSGA